MYYNLLSVVNEHHAVAVLNKPLFDTIFAEAKTFAMQELMKPSQRQLEMKISLENFLLEMTKGPAEELLRENLIDNDLSTTISKYFDCIHEKNWTHGGIERGGGLNYSNCIRMRGIPHVFQLIILINCRKVIIY